MKLDLPIQQTTPATPTSPSEFICSWTPTPEEDSPSFFHLTLCRAAHGRAFPSYLASLWDTLDALTDQLNKAEDDPDLFQSLERQHAELWEHMAEVARQRDYPMPTAAPPVIDNKIDFAAIKARIDLVSYIGKYTALRPSGRSLKGRCPLPTHDDSTASLHVYRDSQTWWCYGCNQGRDIFDFALKMEGLTAAEIRP